MYERVFNGRIPDAFVLGFIRMHQIANMNDSWSTYIDTQNIREDIKNDKKEDEYKAWKAKQHIGNIKAQIKWLEANKTSIDRSSKLELLKRNIQLENIIDADLILKYNQLQTNIVIDDMYRKQDEQDEIERQCENARIKNADILQNLIAKRNELKVLF